MTIILAAMGLVAPQTPFAMTLTLVWRRICHVTKIMIAVRGLLAILRQRFVSWRTLSARLKELDALFMLNAVKGTVTEGSARIFLYHLARIIRRIVGILRNVALV